VSANAAGMSRRVLESAASLGLDLDEPRWHGRPAMAGEGARVLSIVSRVRSVAITGPSGAGKSTLLREIAVQGAGCGWLALVPARSLPERPCADLVGRDSAGAMRMLASAGLADAHCLVRSPRALSAGQRERLRLAMLMAEIDRRRPDPERTLVIVDEFASALDPLGARSLGALLSRWCARRGIGLVVATQRPETLADLRPGAWIDTDAWSAERLRERAAPAGPSLASEIAIEPGTGDDLRAMLALHYRAGEPRAVVRVLRAVHRPGEQLVGVLAIAMPTLNARWRCLAWGGDYTSGPKRRRAERLNAEVRRLARTIVDPRVRSLGVARRLVEAYLARPLTDRTEAFSAHGAAAGFHARAGMQRHVLRPDARQARLLAALASCDLEPWMLASPARALARASRPDLLARELRRWANSSRATRRWADAPTIDLVRIAVQTVPCTAPVAFTAERASPRRLPRGTEIEP